jgi:hypothetical protein
MPDFTDLLPGYDTITYRKEKCVGTDKWLYSFRDSRKAATEENDWLQRAKKNITYSLETLREKQRSFGTIVLECDLDLSPGNVYKAYDKRWEIELVMRYYKSACEFEETREQDGYSVIGNEFCDFLSTLLTFRLIKTFDRTSLLESYTYKKLMSVLLRAKKVRVGGDGWKLIRVNPSYLEILQKLELVPKPDEPPKQRPGRPKGSKNKPKPKQDQGSGETTEATRRRRGRLPGSKNKPKTRRKTSSPHT